MDLLADRSMQEILMNVILGYQPALVVMQFLIEKGYFGSGKQDQYCRQGEDQSGAKTTRAKTAFHPA